MSQEKSLLRGTFRVSVTSMTKKQLSVWETVQRRELLIMFNLSDHSVKLTAQRLGKSRPTILRWLKKYNLYKPLRRA